MSNIKLAGRLSLAYDVLVQALEECQQELPEQLKEVLKPEFKTNLLHKTRSGQVSGRLQEMFDLSIELLDLVKGTSYAESEEIALLKRFLEEQTVYNPETESQLSKETKDIDATSLQSAYDPDATFRNKNGKTNIFILNYI